MGLVASRHAIDDGDATSQPHNRDMSSGQSCSVLDGAWQADMNLTCHDAHWQRNGLLIKRQPAF